MPVFMNISDKLSSGIRTSSIRVSYKSNIFDFFDLDDWQRIEFIYARRPGEETVTSSEGQVKHLFEGQNPRRLQVGAHMFIEHKAI
mmetsp:Transcript_22580/g.31452  ORF Transcript_22580/g.31452 Transcript_22580/m.31452 type:complete len:86 (-) Transcript_22580:118-375(-)